MGLESSERRLVYCLKDMCFATKSQKINEFIYGKARLLEDGAKRALCNFVMVGNHETAMRRFNLPEHDVTPFLAVFLKADFCHGCHDFPTRNLR